MRAGISLLFVVILHSCSSGPQSEIQNLMDSMRIADSIYSATTLAKNHRLNFLRDSLVLASFEYADDYVFYHKHWGGAARGNTNRLSISISETGYLYYTSTLDQQSRTYSTHNSIMLASGTDTLFITDVYDAYQSYDDENTDLTSEHVTFDEYDDRKTAEFILAHRNNKITVTARFYDEELATYELTPEDKQAVADCLMLSNVLNELNSSSLVE